MTGSAVSLSRRGVLRLHGRRSASNQGRFLRIRTRGTLSDLCRVLRIKHVYMHAERVLWSAFLTPQGKFLHEFFVVARSGELLLDCLLANLPALKERLSRYRLHAQVDIENVSDVWAVLAFPFAESLSELGLKSHPGWCRSVAQGVVYTDPRLASLGGRALVSRSAHADAQTAPWSFPKGSVAAYDQRRLALGLAEEGSDLLPGESRILEANCDLLGAIDWEKGCFMGQEVVARTHYRGRVKRRLLPADVLPAPENDLGVQSGAPLYAGTREMGRLRSSFDRNALVLLRLADWEKAGRPLLSTRPQGSPCIRPYLPQWMRARLHAQCNGRPPASEPRQDDHAR